MSYEGNQNDMENIWDWVSHPYPEADQMVPCTPESERDYNLAIPLSPTLVSAYEEPFEDKEYSSGEE